MSQESSFTQKMCMIAIIMADKNGWKLTHKIGSNRQGDEGSILALRNLRRSLEAPPLRVIPR